LLALEQFRSGLDAEAFLLDHGLTGEELVLLRRRMGVRH
jgi:hypothetical protein